MGPRKAFVVLVLVSVATAVRPSAQPIAAAPFVAGEILVKFQPGVNADARAAAHGAVGGSAVAEIQRTGLHRVRVAAGNEIAAIAAYRRNPNVLYAEPNYVRRIPTPVGTGATVVPGDHYFGEQWALDNTGQGFYCIEWPLGGELCLLQGTADADIDAPEAWSILRGSSAVTVAVIDTGIDYAHPDLAANYAGGYDFATPDADPMDDHGHGTHVAGIIAAAMENPTGTPAASEGVAGVAPNARILAYKVCRADGTCDDFAVEQAIARAVTDGAQIINMSLGDTVFSQSLDDAVQDAWNAGLVIVAGAGNGGTTQPFYPAALDNVIAVGAFDEDQLRPYFSNYGNWVDIAAPGNYIMSTYPLSGCTITTTPGDTGCYAWNTGTSMASPHVAGAAALVWSRSDVTSNAQVVDILLNSADGQGVSPLRLDSWTAHGGLNLHDAVLYGLTNLPPLADAGPDQTVADTDHDGVAPVTLDGSGSSDRDGSIVAYEWREGSAPVATGVTPAVTLAIGVHTLTLEVTDDGGSTATDTVVVTVTPANQVSVTASMAQAYESGPVDGRVTISRSGDTGAPLAVHYTVSGTATVGADFVELPGTVTIDAGSATALVAVTPVDDSIYEINESVVLTLTADAAYGLGSPSTATITIVSDDLPPDLSVSSMSAPASAAAGEDLVVTDTTRNQGTGGSPPSTTGFYLSTNGVFDPADIGLGSRQVPALGPGATSAASTTLQIPASTAAGTYYVIARADRDDTIAESYETNNSRASGAVRVGPDLLVTVIAAPSTAAAGSTMDVSDTTKNQGGNAGASSTRFYWSTNTSLDASDQVIGERSVGALAAGMSSSGTTRLSVPAGAAAGAYYVIAQADGPGVVLEASESNNTKTSAAVKVGPDLVVSALSAPATGAAGMSIAVTESTKNQGAGLATSSTTGFYLSSNTTIGAEDTFIGSRIVGALAGGATSTAVVTLQIPPDTASGAYYVIARADWNGGVVESTENNNDRWSSAPIRIGADLTVSALSVPTTLTLGASIPITDSTRNLGLEPAPESVTAFYLSANGSHGAGDPLIGSRTVPVLGSSVTSTTTSTLALPAGTPAGTYYVIAVADAAGAVAESFENNNVRTSGSVRIGPDLTVTAVVAPSLAVAGGSITVTDTTKNLGIDATPVSLTRYYLSTNASFDASDLPLGSREVSALAPGLSETGSATLLIPATTPPGNYCIIARSDGDDAIAEAQEWNNTRARSISVTAPP